MAESNITQTFAPQQRFVYCPFPVAYWSIINGESGRVLKLDCILPNVDLISHYPEGYFVRWKFVCCVAQKQAKVTGRIARYEDFLFLQNQPTLITLFVDLEEITWDPISSEQMEQSRLLNMLKGLKEIDNDF